MLKFRKAISFAEIAVLQLLPPKGCIVLFAMNKHLLPVVVSVIGVPLVDISTIARPRIVNRAERLLQNVRGKKRCQVNLGKRKPGNTSLPFQRTR